MKKFCDHSTKESPEYYSIQIKTFLNIHFCVFAQWAVFSLFPHRYFVLFPAAAAEWGECCWMKALSSRTSTTITTQKHSKRVWRNVQTIAFVVRVELRKISLGYKVPQAFSPHTLAHLLIYSCDYIHQQLTRLWKLLLFHRSWFLSSQLSIS